MNRRWLAASAAAQGVGMAACAAAARASEGLPMALGLERVLLGAAGLGLAVGALLGLAQAAVLSGRVRHRGRWVLANALGWSLAMGVSFAGATTAGASWSWLALVGYGALAGALAGAGLGAVTGAWLDAPDGPPLRHRLVLRHLLARHAPAVDGRTALEVTGATGGRTIRFPVLCAPLGGSSFVVLPGHPGRKTWWRQLGERPMVAFLDAGAWRPARARVIDHGSLEWSVARAAYVSRWRRVRIDRGPLVVLDRSGAAAEVPLGGVWTSPVETGPGAVETGAVAT